MVDRGPVVSALARVGLVGGAVRVGSWQYPIARERRLVRKY